MVFITSFARAAVKSAPVELGLRLSATGPCAPFIWKCPFPPMIKIVMKK